MDNSYLESKITNLQARLRAENEDNQRDNLAKDLTISALCSPRYGSGRRPKREYFLLSIKIFPKTTIYTKS